MKYTVTVKANAKAESVEQLSATDFKVSVKEPPRDGCANEAVIRVLAGHFGRPPSVVTILKGHAAKRKIIEILS